MSMRGTDDGHHMVFAMTFETDAGQRDHLVVALDFLEGARQHLARIDRISGKELFIGLDHALGSIQQAFARRIVSGPADQRTYGRFGLCAGRTRVIGCAHGILLP